MRQHGGPGHRSVYRLHHPESIPSCCGQFVGLTIVFVAPDDLSVAERSLWEAFPRGEWLDLRRGSPSLGQKNYFNPTGLAQWLAYLLMAAGWLLASTIVTAIARVIRRQ